MNIGKAVGQPIDLANRIVAEANYRIVVVIGIGLDLNVLVGQAS